MKSKTLEVMLAAPSLSDEDLQELLEGVLQDVEGCEVLTEGRKTRGMTGVEIALAFLISVSASMTASRIEKLLQERATKRGVKVEVEIDEAD